MSSLRFACLALGAVLLFGCVSAEKRFEQGNEDEAAGRWASACERYLDALRRDPGYPGARERAQVTGSKAIAEWLEVAAGLEQAGRWIRALDEYRRTDSLLDRAAAVGVVLDTPPDYAARRRNTAVQAGEQRLVEADTAAAAGDWDRAVGIYRGLSADPDLSDAQRARARDGQYAALLVGARALADAMRFDEADARCEEAIAIFGADSPRSKDAVTLRVELKNRGYRTMLDDARASMEAGRYQAAWRTVHAALEVYGPDAKQSAEARDLADRILQAGTVAVVATPFAPGRDAADVPQSLRDELDGILEEEAWTAPPLFVAVVEPLAVRREMRRLELDAGELSPSRAAALGQRLGARWVAVLVVERCTRGPVGRGEPRQAKTRDQRPVTYELFRHRTLDVRCGWRLVDCADGSVVERGSFEAGDRRSHDWATVTGTNPEQLLLTWEEHTWFDPDRLREADRTLERSVARDLAPRIAEAVYAEVTRRLP